MYRTFSIQDIQNAVLNMNPTAIGFDPNDWDSEENVALTDGESYTLFEKVCPGIYTAHMLYRKRGKDAIAFGVESLKNLFSLDAELVRGFISNDNKPAKIIATKIGLKSYGEIETIHGNGVLFIMTKDEFNQKYGDMK